VPFEYLYIHGKNGCYTQVTISINIVAPDQYFTERANFLDLDRLIMKIPFCSIYFEQSGNFHFA